MSATKGHAAELIAEGIGFLGVGGVTETFGEVQEFLLFTLLRPYPHLDGPAVSSCPHLNQEVHFSKPLTLYSFQ